jgi:two-component system cell cycle sensor histidine kinase/response regulator CckA
MPGINGRALADRVALLCPAARVLDTSGVYGRRHCQRGVLSEGTAFLQKPYTSEALARKVRDVLDA